MNKIVRLKKGHLLTQLGDQKKKKITVLRQCTYTTEEQVSAWQEAFLPFIISGRFYRSMSLITIILGTLATS